MIGCVERTIICKFRETLGTNLPIKVIEDRDDIIVLVGERVYINVETRFFFVSDVDMVKV